MLASKTLDPKNKLALFIHNALSIHCSHLWERSTDLPLNSPVCTRTFSHWWKTLPKVLKWSYHQWRQAFVAEHHFCFHIQEPQNFVCLQLWNRSMHWMDEDGSFEFKEDQLATCALVKLWASELTGCWRCGLLNTHKTHNMCWTFVWYTKDH